MTTVKTVNETSFESEVINQRGTVLIDFYTETCPPCQIMMPVVNQLADELSDLVKIVKVDASENPFLAQRYKVNSVPTFILFEGGLPKKSKTGVMPPSQLRNWIET